MAGADGVSAAWPGKPASRPSIAVASSTGRRGHRSGLLNGIISFICAVCLIKFAATGQEAVTVATGWMINDDLPAALFLDGKRHRILGGFPHHLQRAAA